LNRLLAIKGSQVTVALISYQWESDNVLRWHATATVDQPCPINLIPHPYWNLDGQPTIENHRIWIAAAQYLPLDERELPLPLADVHGTPFDFQQARCIPIDAIPSIDGALAVGAPASGKLQHAVAPVATCTAGGLTLTVKTDRPFVHLYAAAGLRPQSFIDPATHALLTPQALGVQHQPGAGLCLETEDWPNGPAIGRPEVWYNAARPYEHTALWQFNANTMR
jgi:aldose 1-epimerase